MLIAIPLIRGSYSLNVASQPIVEWSRYANLVINPIGWDFVLGMIGGWLYDSGFSLKRHGMVYAIMTSLLILLRMRWHGWGMVNFFAPHGCAAPLTILFFGTVMLAKDGTVKIPAWSVWMSDMSYSLYLVHVYVFEILYRMATAILMGRDTFNIARFVARPIAAVICAWATFRYVETPISAWARHLLLPVRVPFWRRAKALAPDSVDRQTVSPMRSWARW
jgi:exopolysaccharide production protein ExoZ